MVKVLFAGKRYGMMFHTKPRCYKFNNGDCKGFHFLWFGFKIIKNK